MSFVHSYNRTQYGSNVPTTNNSPVAGAAAAVARYNNPSSHHSRYPATSEAGGFTFVKDTVTQPLLLPPPGANPKLWSWFISVDTDRSGSISPIELQSVLVNGDWTPFDLDTVKLLMSLFDADRTGDINFNEFSGLWRYIEDWQHVFRHFDRDESGTIDGSELQSALSQFGLKLPQHLLLLLVDKFGYEVNVEQQTITFDRFMRACVFVKQFTGAFASLDKNKDGWVQVNYETFLSVCFSLP
ncbi:hypothetical protein B0F90DRAFT_1667832 [Multifurca ochricompacta]|uniref:EF-hand domain-containing protein n=1 Tax=Multifurca ochricompacta TaxID=376703 RepID=A0AAD4M565_9AGAM|nr:hypothetical protein B0F90DRAFT_1667832 [Multifurca ochricompacta]